LWESARDNLGAYILVGTVCRVMEKVSLGYMRMVVARREGGGDIIIHVLHKVRFTSSRGI